MAIGFICGCGHSGTSLLANMFAAHPATYVPLKETEAFLDPEMIDKRWEELMQSWHASGKTNLIEKTPRHIRYLNIIRSKVESAKFIIMVRDGRDVAASFLKRYGTIEPGIARWIDDNRLALNELKYGDALLVKYEDLVATPEIVLKRCCEFLCVDYSPNMLNYHKNTRFWFDETSLRKGNGRDGVEHRALRNWQVNQPLYNNSGQWRENLNTEQKALCQKVSMESLLESFSYKI